MKKFMGVILALIMVLCMSIGVSAEEVTKSFQMLSNTGIINLRGSSSIELSLEPDVFEDDSIILYNTEIIPNITSIKLDVEGVKYHRNYSMKNSYYFKNYYDKDCTIPTYGTDGLYWKLNIYSGTAPAGEFLPEMYEEIYSMGIIVTAYFETDSSRVYYDWNVNDAIINDYSALGIQKEFEYETVLTDLIEDLSCDVKTFYYANKEVKNDYAFLPNTDRDGDGIIYRAEVDCLSYSVLGTGVGVKGFEGLASQVATFFNHKNNGTITFKITMSPAVVSNQWMTGGIPSTQIGFYDLRYIRNNIVGLFFNYESTGSLMVPGTINDNGEIVFDISNVLSDIGGNTVATVHSIFYGLVGGINYTDIPVSGFKIEEVTLSYDDGTKVETTVFPEVTETPVTTTTITEEPNVVSETTESTTVTSDTTTAPIVEETVEDEDYEESIDVDEDEEDDIEEEVDEPEIDNTPAAVLVIDKIEVDDDVNPGTGATLAIIPCGLAGVAVFIFKKRK